MTQIAIAPAEAIDGILLAKGAVFSPIELRFPEQMPLQDWADVGHKLVRADKVVKWWLGDWAAFGLRKYGQLKEFAETNHINYGSLANAAWVSKQVELSRRRETLEWSFHYEVAALPAREQTKWLRLTEEKNLARSELRRQIRLAQGERNALEADGNSVRFISKALHELTCWLLGRPEGFWTDELRAIWRARLQPIVDFYQKLG